jgi:hypothetical protein
MTVVPIACTLTPEGVVGRMEEWRTFLSTMVTKIERTTNQATLILCEGSKALVTAIDLAEREKACCPFFQFSIEIEGLEGRLLVGVPMEAEQILTNFLGVARPDSSAD